MKIKLIDAGNTRLKIAEFHNNQLLKVDFFDNAQDFLATNPTGKFVLASVNDPDLANMFREKDLDVVVLEQPIKTPFLNKYASPLTLGLDRLANAFFMYIHESKGHKLCIDLGTCLKFDFLHSNGEYLGGSISPGLQMRFKALEHFTARLPLVQMPKGEEIQLIGDSTVNSILSGVINGMEAEIVATINRYRAEFGNIQLFLTGGDSSNFDLEQKMSIFADENLTLKGICELYLFNA